MSNTQIAPRPTRTSARLLLLTLLPLLALAALGSLISRTALAATTFTVNSTGDGADSNTADNLCNDGSGNCTLRAAIQQANATAGTDAINFSVTGTINLTGVLPDLASAITISGPGASQLTVRRDTGGEYRIFTVNGGGSVTMSGLTVANGKTPDGVDGGGVNNVGTLTMIDCVVSGNATGGGSGSGSGGNGGGIFSAGPMTLTDVVVSGNTTGAAATNGGGSGGNGGGIYSRNAAATLTRVRVIDNAAGGGSNTGLGGHGGGLYLSSNTVTLTNSTVSNNSAGLSPANSPGFGGGIENTGATLLVYGSTISGNTGFFGGGIRNGGTASLINSTLSGNHLSILDEGAAVHNEAPSQLTLTNCTITANEGFAILHGGPPSGAVLRNSILAGNNGGTDTDLMGSLGLGGGFFSSQGHNIIGNVGDSTGFVASDQVGTSASPIDPKLGPLQDNGGPTLTHALLAGSPALDAGDNALAKDFNNNTLTTDQRGAGRFSGPGVTPTVDVGAVEFNQFMDHVSAKATNEDTPLSFSFFTGDQTVSSLTLTSDNQTLLPNANISVTTSGKTRTVTLTPVADRFGTANITINLTGSFEGMVSQSFAFTVAPVNDAPSFTKGVDQSVPEDSGPQSVANWATGLSAGPNENGQSLSFVVTGNTAPALFSSAPAVSPAGALTYTPAPNAFGSATITLVLKDDDGTANGGQDTSAPQTFVINVTTVNDPPVAAGYTVSLPEDVPTFLNFSGTDADGDSLTFAVVTEPTHGTLSGTGAGRTYTPAANYNGTDSFTYKAIDSHGAESAPATISLTINPVNDAPVNSVPAAQVTNTNTPLVFSAANSNAVSVSDVDAGTDPVRVTLSTPNGTLTLGSTAGLTFVTGDGVDDASFTFTATVAAANAALDGLTYTPSTSFNNGFTSVTIITNDQGFNGAQGAKTDTDAVSIQVRSGGFFRFAQSQTSASEGSGTTVVGTVIRQGLAFGAASVKYTASSNSATGGDSCAVPGVDYINTSGTLNWADGDSSAKFVSLTLCEDSMFEPLESVLFTLSDAGGSGTVLTPGRTSVFIADNDPPGGIVDLEQSSYTVAEGAGGIVVKVKRSGDTSRAASVDYATDDGSIPSVAVPCATTSGTALDRCDFTKALGTINFAGGETEKTFEVLVGDDSFVEGSETALIRLSNPTNGAAFGPRAVATLEITDDAQESSSNPIDESGRFVRQHYHDFLNREPDAPGLAFWTNEIEGCGADAQCREVKRINVSAAFFLSIEFQQTGFFVYRLHKVAYGNLANKPSPLTFTEFLTETQSIGRGVVVGEPGWEVELANKRRQYLEAFVARTRFTALYPDTVTPAAFVDALNINAGGVLSQADRDAL
ncbi:MAG: Ig-like domain-containing protein, partial [Pyrinomonadaceae bacterium]